MLISTIVDEVIGTGKKCAMFGIKGIVISSVFLKREFKLIRVIRQVD